jgi:8-oxo-dGTP pyrophosphatase MutT (NUDIX family)
VVVLRPGRGGVEVLLMRRPSRSSFMGGATVFPGGKLDAADATTPACGLLDLDCADALGLADGELACALYVTAARELFEEAGLLLARTRAAEEPDAVWLQRFAALAQGSDKKTFHAALEASGLEVALDPLVPFERWITPETEPQRFDTVFFATRCPAGQHVRRDEHETDDLVWLRPAAALAAFEAGDRWLAPPTLEVLLRLAADVEAGRLVDGASIDAWLEALGWEGAGEPLLPVPVGAADAVALCLPGDEAHPERPGPPGARWRSRWLDGRFERLRVHAES